TWLSAFTSSSRNSPSFRKSSMPPLPLLPQLLHHQHRLRLPHPRHRLLLLPGPRPRPSVLHPLLPGATPLALLFSHGPISRRNLPTPISKPSLAAAGSTASASSPCSSPSPISSSSPLTTTGSAPLAASPSAFFSARSCFPGASGCSPAVTPISPKASPAWAKPRSLFPFGLVASTTLCSAVASASPLSSSSPSSWRSSPCGETPRASPSYRFSAACSPPRSSVAAKTSSSSSSAISSVSVPPRSSSSGAKTGSFSCPSPSSARNSISGSGTTPFTPAQASSSALLSSPLSFSSCSPSFPSPTHAAALPRLLYTFLAVSFLTFAIPIRLEHNAITLAFAIEGAALVWIGFRALGVLLRPVGYLLLGITAFRLLEQPPAAGAFLFNERFGSYLLLVACLGFSLWSARDSSDSQQSPRRTEMAFLVIATNFFALIALSLEFWDYFGRVSSAPDHAFAQHLSLSILWTCYAGFLLLLGIQRHSPLLRWQALILLGIVVAKVFFFDLSFLARVYRILSFFILGSVLLAVSFFYQRKLAHNRPGP